MSNILPERNYQHYVMDYLEEHNGYHIRDAKTDFDRLYAMDRTLLMKFSTRPSLMRWLGWSVSTRRIWARRSCPS